MIRLVSDIGDAAQWILIVLIPIFVIQYSLLARWWRNPFGRTIVLLDLCLLGVLGPSVYVLADPRSGAAFLTSDGYIYLEVVVLVIAMLIVSSRIWLWERLRRTRHHKDIPGAE